MAALVGPYGGLRVLHRAEDEGAPEGPALEKSSRSTPWIRKAGSNAETLGASPLHPYGLPPGRALCGT